jgi:HlyD family secretion protein
VVAADRAYLDKLEAGPRPQEIEQARAQRDAAAAAVAIVEQRITDATVLAPSDGVITTRASEPGEILPPGALLYVLTDIAHPWLNVYVDEPSLAFVRLGEPVTVRVDGRSESFTGKVTYISQVAEFTPKNVQTPEERAKLVFRIKVGLDNPQGIFKPGMPADAYFGRSTGEGERQ